MKKYLMPILTVIIGGLVIHLFATYLNFPGVETFLVLLRAAVYFFFGVTMSWIKHGRQYTWLRKVIITIIVFFIIAWQLDYVVFPQLASVFTFLGLTDFGFSLVYIYCGWAFFD